MKICVYIPLAWIIKKQNMHCLPNENHSIRNYEYLYLLSLMYYFFQLYHKALQEEFIIIVMNTWNL